MKQSGLLQRQESTVQRRLDIMQRTMKQYMFDTLLITMHEDFGWGYDRLARLEQKWSETYNHYFPALQSTDESDVYQERFDRATRAFLGDRTFYPFPERYPDIKRLGYEPKRRRT